MRFVIVTGMSGAGKSSVLKMLEDAGYFCVDNLPVPLILKFAEISWHEENQMSGVALGFAKRNPDHGNFYITLLSFGFKYGIPADADLVFDVRFLPNPYYVEELKHQTGNDAPVYEYVMQSEDAGVFLNQLYEMLVFLIPRYITEGKNQLVVAIGCTGGKHRSVTITNALYKRLENLEYSVKAEHRDIDRDVVRVNQQMR